MEKNKIKKREKQIIVLSQIFILLIGTVAIAYILGSEIGFVSAGEPGGIPIGKGVSDTAKEIKNKPTVIIAHTTKGRGVSFMENKAMWHGRPPNDEEYKKAVYELKGRK